MAEMNEKRRKSLKSSEFGEPKERKYPMPDRAHAANAKARASEMEKKGKLSAGEKSRIDAKADKMLGKGKKK